MRAEMHKGGAKTFKIDVDQLKVFIHPYFYLMLDIFFWEGQPTYAENSFDKPNEYTADIEDSSDIFCKVVMSEILVCLSSGA